MSLLILTKMIFLFSILSLSVFVPLSKTYSASIQTLSLDEVKSNSQLTHLTHFALFINEKSKQRKNLTQKVDQASILHDNVVFSYLTEKSIENYTKELEYSPHLFLVVKEGNVENVFPINDEEESIFPMFDFFSETKHHLFTEETELLEYLGKAPFSIITTQENFERAQQIQKDVAAQMGYVELLLTTQQILATVAENQTAIFGLYRREDGFIVNIIDDIEEIYQATYPVYRMLRKDDLATEAQPIFAIAPGELTEIVQELLIELGASFPEIVVGYATQEIMTTLSKTAPILDTKIKIAFTNPRELYYYNISGLYPTELLENDFNADEFYRITKDLFERAVNGEIVPEYQSEDIPEYDEVFQKVVGKNYLDFISNTTSESLILYMKPTCPHCRAIMPVITELATALHDAKANIRVGYIDISRNGCSEGFPSMRGVPTLYLFKDGGKNKTQLYCQRTKDEYIRNLKIISDQKIDIETVMPDSTELANHLLTIIMSLDEENPVPDEEKEAFQNYLERESNLLQSMSNSTETNETQQNDEKQEL